MRTWLLFLALTACELEPPPKPRPAPAPAAPAPAPAPVVANGSGSAVAVSDVSDACVQAGVAVAEALIADTKDETQKGILEREKTRTVRRTAEDCTYRHW